MTRIGWAIDPSQVSPVYPPAPRWAFHAPSPIWPCSIACRKRHRRRQAPPCAARRLRASMPRAPPLPPRLAHSAPTGAERATRAGRLSQSRKCSISASLCVTLSHPPSLPPSLSRSFSPPPPPSPPVCRCVSLSPFRSLSQPLSAPPPRTCPQLRVESRGFRFQSLRWRFQDLEFRD